MSDVNENINNSLKKIHASIENIESMKNEIIEILNYISMSIKKQRNIIFLTDVRDAVYLVKKAASEGNDTTV